MIERERTHVAKSTACAREDDPVTHLSLGILDCTVDSDACTENRRRRERVDAVRDGRDVVDIRDDVLLEGAVDREAGKLGQIAVCFVSQVLFR